MTSQSRWNSYGCNSFVSSFIYLMEFDMKTPMLSRRYVPTSLKISSDMIKLGKVQHPRPFEERMKDYRGTYKDVLCVIKVIFLL